jgi:lysine N6-hydroxylase
VQNVGLHTHGFVTPDLGMVCCRNACIIKAVTGKEHYPIEHSIAFQRFSAPEEKISAFKSSGISV